MKRKAGKITALALAAAMSVTMLPAAAFADSDDGLTTIRIMGINNTVTTVDGGTVSLQVGSIPGRASSTRPSRMSWQSAA